MEPTKAPSARSVRTRTAIAMSAIVVATVCAWLAVPARGDDSLPPEMPRGRSPRGMESRMQPAEYSMLDQLERAVDRLQGVSASAREIEAIEADAQEVVERSPYADERIRARRVLRRMSRVPVANEPVRESRRVVSRSREVTADYEAPPVGERRAAPAQYYAPAAEPGCEIPPATQYAVPAPVLTAPAIAPVIDPYQTVAPAVVPCALPPVRHYVSLDALGWWVKGDSLPPLVTTSPVGTPQDQAGVLGQPDTAILYGNQAVNGGIRPGGRVLGGIWIDRYQTWALEGHYYALATQTANYYARSVFSGGSTSDPILARPFFNNSPGVDAQDSMIVAFPNYILPPVQVPPIVANIDGSIQVKETSDLYSAGAVVRWSPMVYTNPFRVSFTAGYRFFVLTESLTILAISTPPPIVLPIPVANARVEVFDSFSTRNTFNGGEIGITGELGGRSRVSLMADARLAMGNMHEVVTIDGRTSAIAGPFTASYVGGLLAQPTNIGTFSQDRFALIPQVDVKLGFQVTPILRLTVGYNFTYISSVIRPGTEVDTTVNTTQVAGGALVGPARPAPQLDPTSIWLQGVTAGFDLRF